MKSTILVLVANPSTTDHCNQCYIDWTVENAPKYVPRMAALGSSWNFRRIFQLFIGWKSILSLWCNPSSNVNLSHLFGFYLLGNTTFD